LLLRIESPPEFGVLRTRFAPSPTGPLHLGHALSALTAHDLALSANGEFLIRFEDIDRSRSHMNWETQILEDLRWLGVTPRAPPARQSERMPLYEAALNTLWATGLLYECRCSRADIRAALSAPQERPVAAGPDGPVYPGTCRGARRSGPRPGGVLRLDMRAAVSRVGAVAFQELSDARNITFSAGELVNSVGDVVLSRRDMGTSYHLSVVVDDASQEVTHVVRGRDLFDATAIHVVLQRLLDLPTPIYLHHPLVRDAEGRRLAKRQDSRSIATYRSAGATPSDIRRMVGLAQISSVSSTSAPPRMEV
jgi:glutamyl-Q tRNA(Asp) synthetase